MSATIMKVPLVKDLCGEKRLGMTLDVCYGGCGGIWSTPTELERVSARAASTLHTIWQIKRSNVKLTEPRLCPRCPERCLSGKWFSDLQQVEIDQCPSAAAFAGRRGVHPHLRGDPRGQSDSAGLGNCDGKSSGVREGEEGGWASGA